MIKSDKYWVTDGESFYDIKNPLNSIHFNWTGNYSGDYIQLSNAYFETARTVIAAILNESSGHEKSDEWFFPAIYLYRQAIELLCKGLLFLIIPKKEMPDYLKKYSHRIYDAFNIYLNTVGDAISLNITECVWITNYLENLEYIDANSNLFRYPIREGYLSGFKDAFLDIVDMANGINQCYSIMYKCVPLNYNPLKYSAEIDLSTRADVLYFASHGIRNCMLYDSPFDAGYYPHIQGYSKLAYFLIDRMPKNHCFFLPIAFLIRHAIELGLKCILVSRVEHGVMLNIQKKNINSHNLYKKLWSVVKEPIKYYADISNYDLSLVQLTDKYLCELRKIDKEGKKFRYPTTNGLEYHFKNLTIDYYQSIHWMISVFNFLDGCTAMMEMAYDYENQIRTEMKSEIY